MPELIMLIGIPGSGKSTKAEEYQKEHPEIHIHSSDELRFKKEYGYTKAENIQLFQELHQNIITDLQNGISCIYDATNINRRNRIAFFTMLREKRIECKKIAWLFIVSPETCKKQNDKREGKAHVPEDTIDRMLMNFHMPYYHEGFDEIIVFREENVTPEYTDETLEAFMQDTPYHSLSLLSHMKKAEEYILQMDLSKHRKDYLSHVARWHDIGKYYTKTFTDTKGNISDIAHYYGHEHYGAYLYLLYHKKNKKEGLYEAVIIDYHMHPYKAWKQSERVKERDKNTLSRTMYYDIMYLNKADKYAH